MQTRPLILPDLASSQIPPQAVAASRGLARGRSSVDGRRRRQLTPLPVAEPFRRPVLNTGAWTTAASELGSTLEVVCRMTDRARDGMPGNRSKGLTPREGLA